MRSVDPNLPLQAKPLADYFRCLVKYLCEVTSGFFLNQNGRRGDFEVCQRSANCHVFHSISHFKAVVLLVKTYPEFAADRLLTLTSYKTKGGIEAMSGTEGTYHQIKCLWQFLFKLAKR